MDGAAAVVLAAGMIEKQQRERAHLESFVNRFKAQASKARQAQSRMKMLAKMEDLAPLHVLFTQLKSSHRRSAACRFCTGVDVSMPLRKHAPQSIFDLGGQEQFYLRVAKDASAHILTRCLRHHSTSPPQRVVTG